MTTFRDLAVDADRQLTAATTRLGVLSQAEAVQVARELADLTRICGRILDDALADRTGTAPTPRWVNAARAGRDRIDSAERLLTRAVTAYAPNGNSSHRRAPGPVAPLNTAVRRLGLGEEMLRTELTARPARRRSGPDERPVLEDPAAQELTTLTGRWIGMVGEVAGGLANQIQGPRHPFRVGVPPMPQVFRQAAGCARHARAVIAAVTGTPTQISGRLAELPRRRAGAEPPLPPELSVLELLGKADERASAVRRALHDPIRQRYSDEPPVSARSLRYVATAAGSVHTTATIVARQLAARVAELRGTADVPEYRALVRAADALIESSRAWHTAARSWDGVTTSPSKLHNPAVHATGTVMAVGRAAFADPEWTPTSRNTRVRPAAEFATDHDAARHAAVCLSSVVTAYTGAARASARLVQELHHDGALHIDDNGAAPDDAVAALREAYGAVLTRAVTADRWLRTAIDPTGRDPADAPALAATAFPTAPLAAGVGSTEQPHIAAAGQSRRMRSVR